MSTVLMFNAAPSLDPPPTSPFSASAVTATVLTASNASEHMRSDHLEENLVPMEVLIKASISLSDEISTGMEIFWIVSRASFKAALKARMITTGWMFRSKRGKE